MKEEKTKKKPGIPPFESTVCQSCGHTQDYSIRIDKGTAMTMMAIANRIRIKGKNQVHLLQEMTVANPKAGGFDTWQDMVRAGFISMRMLGNATRPRLHGLIAFHDEGSGQYLLTPKGAKFLRGDPVELEVIVEKLTHSNVGYRGTADGPYMTTIHAALRDEAPFWDLETYSKMLGKTAPDGHGSDTMGYARDDAAGPTREVGKGTRPLPL
jgi:hypothetical protein